jgi:hypothetical protein
VTTERRCRKGSASGLGERVRAYSTRRQRQMTSSPVTTLPG